MVQEVLNLYFEELFVVLRHCMLVKYFDKILGNMSLPEIIAIVSVQSAVVADEVLYCIMAIIDKNKSLIRITV